VREPLTELLSRTLAVDQLLADRLSALEGVRAAAIYGSWAAGRVGPGSDIDVLVVGTVPYDDLISALRPVERQAGREISVKLFRPAEYRERVRARSGFLRTVLSRPIRELVGDLDDVGEAVP
jgi:predicted nucleotidyltransferase